MKYTILAFISILFILNESFSQTNSGMTDKSYATEIIRYKISADQQENFMSAYSEAAKHLQASPFCRGYDIIQGQEEPANFIVRIYWTSKEDHLSGFRKSTEFAA